MSLPVHQIDAAVMTQDLYSPQATAEGTLARNILHFGRLLRRAGLPVGLGASLDATSAVQEIDIGSRTQFYWALRAAFVRVPEQRFLFEGAFQLFWRAPRALESWDAAAALGPTPPPRLAEAFGVGVPMPLRPAPQSRRDAAATWSAQEALRSKDFEQMTTEEAREARDAARALAVALVWARRLRCDPRGARWDWRATARRGGEAILLQRCGWRPEPPPVVMLCDVSGSMDSYARMSLIFAHGLTAARRDVFTFLFGTRLTNLTRALRHRDPDVSLERVAAAVADWSSCTRIGSALYAFNRQWVRRLPRRRAWVVLVTDGLDRDGGALVSEEAARLRRACGRLIWLNPLRRYAGYEARAAGARALSPHVDEVGSAHDLASLARRAALLATPETWTADESVR